MHVLNGKELSMLPHVARFRQMGIARLRIEGKSADAPHIARVTRAYRTAIDRGENWRPELEADWTVIEHGDITRGHYFRGVL
jgi:putative protease